MRPENPAARQPALALVAATGVVGVYFAARAGGPIAGLLAAASAACGGGLILARMELAPLDIGFAARAFDGVLLALPGALTVYLAFDAGGFLPDAQALAAIALALLLLLRVTLVEAPFAGFSRPLGVAVAALGLYALWVLLSGIWSDAPARALIEFDRALLYLLALVLFGSIPRRSDQLRWILRGLALGIVVVATVALATRVLPDVFPTAPGWGSERLSYPLTYTNALGILGVIGAVLCLHITMSLHEAAAVRALGAAALPILGSTVLLTFSRGAIAAGAIGVAAYVVLGRPLGLVSGLIATLPTTIVAVQRTDAADLLAGADPTTAAAVAQGHDLAVTVAACALAAGAIRLLLFPLDTRLRRMRLPEPLLRPEVTSTAWVAAAAAVLVIAVAAGVPDRVSSNYERFVETPTREEGSQHERLSDPSNTGRIDYWKAAFRGFEERPLRGHGAGTYEHLWSKERPEFFTGDWASDAHSLYVETLGELGLVGLVLLLAALAAIAASMAPLKRGQHRSLYAALFTAAIVWAIHAGIDWDWEMPATTLWLFAVGGAALATHQRDSAPRRPTQGARVIVGLLLVLACIAPALLLSSQHQLDDAYAAFNDRDCPRTIERAAASISTLEIRPEPYEAIAYCQVRRGNSGLAVEAMQEAVERDPENWKLHYGLALVRGAAGLDPRPAARAARRLNPHSVLAKDLVNVLRRRTAEERRVLTTNLARDERGLTLVP